jgi:hypothetical protein
MVETDQIYATGTQVIYILRIYIITRESCKCKSTCVQYEPNALRYMRI